MKDPLIGVAATLYGWIVKIARWLQPVFLLCVRLYWGWQFFITGKGKLESIPKVTDYFQSLGIPFPGLNAYMAGCTECFCGLFLLLGIASRITTVPLIITMIVAYLTASQDAVKQIFQNQDPFLKDDAFTFLAAAVIVFVFGPGLFSVDGLIGHLLKKKSAGEKAGA